MKNRSSTKDEESKNEVDAPKFISMMKKKKKKNMMRLGGSALSLEAFANAKSTNNKYNPALIKKQREFYKNAKYVSKFKKKLRPKTEQNESSSTVRPLEDNNEAAESIEDIKKSNNNKKKQGSYSLKKLYEKQHEEKEKARMEREAIIKAKREEREKAEAHRKGEREKMFKKTRRGQPVMKYRIEHILQTIQGSN